MKAIFVGSKNGYTKIPDTFDVVLKVLHEKKVEVLGPTTQVYSDVVSKAEMKGKSREEIHALFMRKVISAADAMILESSFDGFALGHEATLALEQNKPVLAITQKDTSFSFIHDPKFFVYKYKNASELAKPISEFIINYNKKFRTIRINVLLNQRHENFLNWMSKNKGINKSLIVRQLIDEQIQNSNDYPNKIVY